MRRRILILSLVVLGLAIADYLLSQYAADARFAGTTAHRLGDALGDDTPQITEVRLIDGRGGALEFTNTLDGLWRSPSVLGAPAAIGPLDRFVKTMLDCEGFIRSALPEQAARYGIESETALHVSLHGPGMAGEVGSRLLLAADIGYCLPEAEQCFVRPAGQASVWAMECDLRSLLTTGPPGMLPPLVDPHLVPDLWPGKQFPLRRVVITPTGQGAIELQRHDGEAPPQEPSRPGEAPWTWVLLDAAGARLPLHQGLANSFNTFVLNVPFAGITPPEEAVELDWEHPRARVVLYPDAGAPLELRLGEAQAQGTPVYNSFARLVYILSPEAAGLLAPSAARLGPGAAVDPWMAMLERMYQESQAPGMPPPEDP